jgi:hypothetical protein
MNLPGRVQAKVGKLFEDFVELTAQKGLNQHNQEIASPEFGCCYVNRI